MSRALSWRHPDPLARRRSSIFMEDDDEIPTPERKRKNEPPPERKSRSGAQSSQNGPAAPKSRPLMRGMGIIVLPPKRKS